MSLKTDFLAYRAGSPAPSETLEFPEPGDLQTLTVYNDPSPAKRYVRVILAFTERVYAPSADGPVRDMLLRYWIGTIAGDPTPEFLAAVSGASSSAL